MRSPNIELAVTRPLELEEILQLRAFENRIVVAGPKRCWIHTGAKSYGGYVRVSWRGKGVLAHRLAYLLYNGTLPAPQRADGRGGWFRTEECTVEYLRELLAEHVAKGDMVDIANLAMMVWNRENPNG